MALHTVRSTNLRHITIRPSLHISSRMMEEPVPQEWHDLDRLLVQFLSSHSIRPQFAYRAGIDGRFLRSNIQGLLPELIRKGALDLVEYNPVLTVGV